MSENKSTCSQVPNEIAHNKEQRIAEANRSSTDLILSEGRLTSWAMLTEQDWGTQGTSLYLRSHGTTNSMSSYVKLITAAVVHRSMHLYASTKERMLCPRFKGWVLNKLGQELQMACEAPRPPAHS
jgi:hypothetical protein